MNLEFIQQYAEARALSHRDALQTYMQVVVLKELSHPTARLMGGTALVLGHGNPRFSEDIDLTQVSDPHSLKVGLERGTALLRRELDQEITLVPPKAGRSTWRLQMMWNNGTVRLHIDSQTYPSYSRHAIVVEYPPLLPIVCDAVTVDEIMADKLIAIAYRSYLGGRDLFDLWFHWLRHEDREDRLQTICDYLGKKLEDRSLDKALWRQRLSQRLTLTTTPKRVREEWQRYLPRSFQRDDVAGAILVACRSLPEWIIE